MKQRCRKFLPVVRSGRFYGSFRHVPDGFFLKSLSMFLKSCIFRLVSYDKPINLAHPTPPVKSSNSLAITWIGHSTFLIQCAGLNILTDPIFGNNTFLYPRIYKPGIMLNELPNIDMVVISHNHWDHMDSASLLALKKRFPEVTVLAPHGDKKWFDSRGFERTLEASWWESQDVDIPNKSLVRCTFLPAVHWSQNYLFDRNCSLWGSWMIEVGGNTIYFGGDTAYGEHFSVIGEEFPSIDVALLPIGPCEPRDWTSDSHMNAIDAGHAFLDLKAHQFIPMHWGTFHYGNEPVDLPLLRLRNWWYENSISLKNQLLHTPKLGQRLLLEKAKCIFDHNSVRSIVKQQERSLNNL